MHPMSFDATGRRRAAVTQPGYHAGRSPRNKGRRYPADPPTVEEIVAVMRTAGTSPDGVGLRALIVVLWRAGLRISEALALSESDMDSRRGAVLVRAGKGNKRLEVGMDTWAWDQLVPWRELRARFPVGTFFCVVHGATAGWEWEASCARRQLARTAAAAGVRRRFAPHQLRHAHAVEMAREGVPLVVIQRQLGHANLGVTSCKSISKRSTTRRSSNGPRPGPPVVSQQPPVWSLPPTGQMIARSTPEPATPPRRPSPSYATESASRPEPIIDAVAPARLTSVLRPSRIRRRVPSGGPTGPAH